MSVEKNQRKPLGCLTLPLTIISSIIKSRNIDNPSSFTNKSNSPQRRIETPVSPPSSTTPVFGKDQPYTDLRRQTDRRHRQNVQTYGSRRSRRMSDPY